MPLFESIKKSQWSCIGEAACRYLIQHSIDGKIGILKKVHHQDISRMNYQWKWTFKSIWCAAFFIMFQKLSQSISLKFVSTIGLSTKEVGGPTMFYEFLSS